MRGSYLVAIWVVLFCCSVVKCVSAEPVLKRFDEGTQTCREITYKNVMTGYKIFRTSCKTCHYQGNQDGTRFLYSESKTPKAWNRVFTDLYPECVSAGAWDSLAPTDRLALNDYLLVDAFGNFDPNQVGSCFS